MLCFIPKSTLISDQQKTENWLYIKHLGYELENCGICCFPQATQSTSLRACARAITTIEFNKFTADNGRLVACGTNNTTNNNRCWLFSFFFLDEENVGNTVIWRISNASQDEGNGGTSGQSRKSPHQNKHN